MATLFVRERRHVGKGEGQPRYELVAVSGVDLRVYHSHLRKLELEKIAEAVGAELVYLPRGEQSGEEGRGAGPGHRHRRVGGGGGRSQEQE